MFAHRLLCRRTFHTVRCSDFETNTSLRAIFFDVAGTLISNRAVILAYLEAFLRTGIKLEFNEVTQFYSGQSKFATIENILQKHIGVRTEWEKLYQRKPIELDTIRIYNFYQHQQIRILKEKPGLTQFLPWTLSMLHFIQQHHNLKIGISSNFSEEALSVVQSSFRSQGFFPQAYVNATEIKPFTRPDCAALKLLRSKMKLDKNDLVMKVGDSKEDMEEGRNLFGCVVVGMTANSIHHPLEEFSLRSDAIQSNSDVRSLLLNNGAHYVIHDITRLNEIIEKHI